MSDQIACTTVMAMLSLAQTITLTPRVYLRTFTTQVSCSFTVPELFVTVAVNVADPSATLLNDVSGSRLPSLTVLSASNARPHDSSFPEP